ncbi:hypothetical protein PACTADRAFT_30463, partial [Pachysolen tannophilus NRRL Y-2460]
MSEEDDDFMQMSEDEDDYSFEYEDDDDDLMDDEHNDLDNEYFSAKAAKEEDLQLAIKQFSKILKIQDRNDINSEYRFKYCFKSLKQLLKIYFQLGDFNNFLQKYNLLFEIIPKLNNYFYAEESINKILDHYDNSNLNFLNKFIEMTLKGIIENFKNINNDRLWLKANLKKCNLLISQNFNDEALKLLSSLQKICESSNSETLKGRYMLELLALQIQLLNGDESKFHLAQKLYRKTLLVSSAVPHPRIIGIIKEFGGEMYMKKNYYNKASNEFYESFKNYDESGNYSKRLHILKKLIISNMLSQSEINPFQSKEFQSFISLDEIKTYIDLYYAFINVDIKKFNNLILMDQTIGKLSDSSLIDHMDELQTIIRLKTILKVIKYYDCLELSYLGKIFNCNIDEVENLLLRLISSGKLINLRINYIDKTVEI